MAKMIFVNLPVTDLGRATAFYQAVGAEKNEQFCDGTASCMVFSETIHAMLLTHDKFRQFTPKEIADAMVSLLTDHDLRRRCGKALQTRVRRYYDRDRVREAYAALYDVYCDAPSAAAATAAG